MMKEKEILMHSTKDFSLDSSKLTSEFLEERKWKKRALLEVLDNDVFTKVRFARIVLDWDLSTWKLVFSDPVLGIEAGNAIMFKHGRGDPKRLRRGIRLCCKAFTKMNVRNMCFGSNFHKNCLEVLEDLIEFMLNNTIIYDIGPLATREVRLWEKWTSLEEIYLKARL